VQSIEVARGIMPRCSAPEYTLPSSLSLTLATSSSRVNSKGVVISAATAKALADAPSWLDPDKTLEAMTICGKGLLPKSVVITSIQTPNARTMEINTPKRSRKQQSN